MTGKETISYLIMIKVKEDSFLYDKDSMRSFKFY